MCTAASKFEKSPRNVTCQKYTLIQIFFNSKKKFLIYSHILTCHHWNVIISVEKRYYCYIQIRCSSSLHKVLLIAGLRLQRQEQPPSDIPQMSVANTRPNLITFWYYSSPLHTSISDPTPDSAIPPLTQHPIFLFTVVSASTPSTDTSGTSIVHIVSWNLYPPCNHQTHTLPSMLTSTPTPTPTHLPTPIPTVH